MKSYYSLSCVNFFRKICLFIITGVTPSSREERKGKGKKKKVEKYTEDGMYG
jgi:hypothetical protein